MRYKKTITSSLLAGTLVFGFSAPAFAAENFEVGFDTTLAELKAAVNDPATQSVTFTADNSFNGGLVIAHPMTFTINDGVNVTFDGSYVADKTGLDVKSEFTFINNGNVTIENFAGYGMKINQKTANQSVILRGDGETGSSLSISTTGGYGIDGQFIKGPFTVSDTTLNVTPGPDTKEGPIIFSKNGGKDLDTPVVFNNSTVTIDHASKTSVWPTAFYSERPVTFRNSTLNSKTSRRYNLSFTSGEPVLFDNSIVDLVTPADAKTEGSWIFKKPFTSINTGRNTTVTIEDSKITSNISATAGEHQAFQFQDATYNIISSTVIGDSLGVDLKQTEGSNLNISGDSKVDIPGTANMPGGISTVIDGGTVVLPQNATAKNTQGQDLYEFISDGASNKVLINCTNMAYNYPVSNISNDVLKHVWAPAVNVDYYVKETDTEPDDTRKLIAGTNVDEDLNGVDFFTAPEVPKGFTGKFVIFDPAPESEFTSASKVCKNTKVTFRINQTPLVPIPDVETTDLEVFVGDTVKPTDGLVDLPEGATIEIITPADTTTAGKTTQTVKITFENGSSITKVINIKVVEHLTPLVPAEPKVQPPMPEKPGLAKTGVSGGIAGLFAGLLLIAGTGVTFFANRRKNT